MCNSVSPPQPYLTQVRLIGRCGSAAKRSPHRPGISRALGLRARRDGLFIVSQTELSLETQTMFLTSWLRGFRAGFGRMGAGRRRQQKRALRWHSFLPRLEFLEDRTLPSTLTVLNNLDSGPGSLRAEIAEASSGDTIVFASALKNQTITLASELVINTNLDIEGLGATRLAVSGNGVSRVFDIAGGANATIAGLAIINGSADQGAGIFNEPGASLTVIDCAFLGNLAVGSSFGVGGGILNEGSATVSGSTFDGNQATGGDGGAGA